MRRILLYETTYRRLQPRLAAHKDALAFLIMRTDGTIELDGQALTGEPEPEIGWFNTDVFFSPHVRDYAVAMLKSPNLQWVQSSAAGYDEPIFRQIVQKARLTTNHSHAPGISEYVMAGVLDHMQGGPRRRADQAARVWKPAPYREIQGTEWLIVGFGAIGQNTAQRAKAFGARITGVRRSGGSHPLADVMATPDQLPALLPGADVVVLSLPLNRQTEAMVDAPFLAAMKSGSVFVNVGRGGLVDEAALVAALDRGAPEHAVLDVARTEPLPADSPLWAHPRISLTPHASGLGSGVSARSDAVFLGNLARYLAGEPLLNEVDAKEVAGG